MKVMANKKKTKSGRKTRRPTKEELARQAAIKRMLISMVLTVVLIFTALKMGAVGVSLYNLLRLLVGSLAYLFIMSLLFYLFFFRKIQQYQGWLTGSLTIFSGLLLISQAIFVNRLGLTSHIFSTTLSLILKELIGFQVTQFVGGGLLGSLLYAPISFLFSNIGSYFIGLLLLLMGALIFSNYSIYDIFEKMSEHFHKWQALALERREKRFLKKEQRATKKAFQQEQEKENLAPEKVFVDIQTGEVLDEETLKPAPILLNEEEISEASADEIPSLVSAPSDTDHVWLEEEASDEVAVNFHPLKEALLYKLPTIDLFAPDKPKNQSKEKTIVRKNIKILEDTFSSFNIKASVERAEIGPSVTKYEVKPPVGVRVNRISNLADDLALALAAKDVRIEAPIPGKSLVGIEVPNSEIATVSFRELWEQSKTNPDNLLEIPLGKAVNGSSRTFDLAKMPHLLVAGSTGSGKSVAVNGIIASILMKARPDQVKFMMVDPKMVELSVYNDIPHLLIPVVTNPRKASKALQKVVDEMENRYELFSAIGVRNIAGFNAKVEEYNAQSEEKQIPLPLIVVIVDELADLMMVASKEVEDAIIRLGQKARAAGIHMILATQRPSVDVISGLIKANVPSRVAFAVSSGTDSRTILDENGAEKLLGRGDMLFKPIDENHPIRLQGSFISDEDVERIVTFIKEQASADYDESFDPGEVTEEDLATPSSSSNEGDPLFVKAKSLVIETQKASASMLQRRLSVGFNRATRLMEELEAAGVIGPAEGTKPRKVLQQE